jgi:uncharacterized protein (UPF0210 family)
MLIQNNSHNLEEEEGCQKAFGFLAWSLRIAQTPLSLFVVTFHTESQSYLPALEKSLFSRGVSKKAGTDKTISQPAEACQKAFGFLAWSLRIAQTPLSLFVVTFHTESQSSQPALDKKPA